MSRKLDIRTRMQELQKEFSLLNSELKEMEHAEEHAAKRERYKDFKFKVGSYGYKIEGEEKVQEATDEDKEHANTGRSGLVYTGFNGDAGSATGFGYIMLKEKEDYKRTVRICEIIDAVEHLVDEKEKDKEKYIKVILGESTDEK